MRKMTLLALAVAATLSTGAVAGKYDARASMMGIGPIRIGMNVHQLENAIQSRIPDTEDEADDSCRMIEAGPREAA